MPFIEIEKSPFIPGFFLTVLLCSPLLARAQDVTEENSKTAKGIDLLWGVKIPLRDGVKLNANVYKPEPMAAPLPVIVTLTPYTADSNHAAASYLAQSGYVFAVVDARGRGNSEGAFDPFVQQINDGYDVVEWLARQPWSNGKVAIWGGSYAGSSAADRAGEPAAPAVDFAELDLRREELRQRRRSSQRVRQGRPQGARRALPRRRAPKLSGNPGGEMKGNDMNYYALFYYVVDDFISRRSPYRGEHLRLAREANRRGELLLAGALSDPADQALLVFRAPDRSVAEDFARNDPYVTNGLVARWEVRSWTVVIGNEPSDVATPGGAQ